jgi:hypothetical protein
MRGKLQRPKYKNEIRIETNIKMNNFIIISNENMLGYISKGHNAWIKIS